MLMTLNAGFCGYLFNRHLNSFSRIQTDYQQKGSGGELCKKPQDHMNFLENKEQEEIIDLNNNYDHMNNKKTYHSWIKSVQQRLCQSHCKMVHTIIIIR